MKQLTSRHVLWLALLIYMTACAWLFIENTRTFDGIFIYSVDDPYIHMQIIQNLKETGIFGLSDTFTTTSSSILWSALLLLCSFILGDTPLLALGLNVLFGLMSLYLLYRIAQETRLGKAATAALLGFTLFSSYLVLLTFVGMEHVLSLCLALWFSLTAMRYSQHQTSIGMLYLSSALLVACRYELSFLVLAACIWLFFRKERGKAFLLGITSFSLVTAAGIWFMSNGSHFFPNTLLVKGNGSSFLSAFSDSPVIGLTSLVLTLCQEIGAFIQQNLLLIFPLLLVVFTRLFPARGHHWWSFGMAFLVYGMLHHLFLGISALYFRYTLFYDIFLLFLMVYLFEHLLTYYATGDKAGTSKVWKRNLIVLPCVILVVVPYCFYFNWHIITPSSQAIHDQQYQMSKFIGRYYPKGHIAANDIGMIAYYNKDISLLDLWGLASNEVTEAKINGQYNTAFIQQLIKKENVDVIMVYDNWFDRYGGLPENWTKVAEWTNDSFRIVGEKVSFYAQDKKRAETLYHHMKAFENELPKSVELILFPLKEAN